MIKASNRKPIDRRLYYAAITLILLIATWLRLADLMRLPLFLDEAIHIERSHIVLGGRVFIGMQVNKWLHPVVLSIFHPTGPEGPWLARAVSALLGVFTVALCIALGKQLGERRAALLAGLFYAVLPFAIFHERQALAEPLVTAFATLAMLLMVHMARRPIPWLIVPLGVSLAGAYLTKPAAIPYLALPFAAVILLTPSPFQRWLEHLLGRPIKINSTIATEPSPPAPLPQGEGSQDREFIAGLNSKVQWKKLLLGLLFSLLAVILAVGLITVFKQAAQRQGETAQSSHQISIENLIFADGEGDTLAHLTEDLGIYADTQVKYLGWAAVVLIGLALIWLVIGGRRAILLFLLAPGLVFAVVPLLADRPAGYLAPRYLHATAGPLAVLAALTVLWLDRGRRTRWAGLILSITLIGQALFFDARFIADPLSVQLPEPDQIQYQIGEPSGYGHADVAAYVLELKTDQPANLLINGSAERLVAYLGPRTGAVWRYRGEAAQRYAIARLLAAGEPVYYAVIDSAVDSPDAFGAQVELLRSFKRNGRLHRLYQITGADGVFAREIYEQIPPDPDQVTQDIEALSATLGDHLVLAYPPKFGPALSGPEVQPLALDSWPLEAEQIIANLDDLPADHAPVGLVIVNEAQSDPDRRIILTFEQNLYRVDEGWFGLLHRIDYLTGPTDPPMEPLDAVFEDVIELQAGAIIDPEVPPGAVVRFAFRWETAVPVQDSFVVFAHVVGEDGTLWAQHDSVPGSGLLPLTTWDPGQPVTDRFTISLPPDIPPGEYMVRMGLYNPDSGLRLRVTDGLDVGPDDVVVGRVTVTE